MVDDRTKDGARKGAPSDAKRRMEDRTVPMPVPRGGTLSADTLEAEPKSFIGEEHLRASSDEPVASARPASPSREPSEPTRPPASFDEEIAKNRAPAPRPATVVRRSPLLSARADDAARAAASEAPSSRADETAAATIAPGVASSVARGAVGETSDPTPSSVFASRASLNERANDALRSASGYAVPSAALTAAYALGDARPDAADAAEPILSGAPQDAEADEVAEQAAHRDGGGHDDDKPPDDADDKPDDEPDDEDDAATLPIEAPTLPLMPAMSGGAPPTAPVPAGVELDAGPTVEQTAAQPARSLVPRSDPVAQLPDRIAPEERERLANEATRIRSAKTPAAPPPSGSGRGAKLVVLALCVGLAGAGAALAMRARERAPNGPRVADGATAPEPLAQRNVTTRVDAPRVDDARARPAADAETRTADDARALTNIALAAESTSEARDDASAWTSAPALAAHAASDIGARLTRRGFHDVSGSGAIGLAQALEAGVRPAIQKARGAGLALRGEILRASVARGTATLDCNLTIVDAQTRRVTLQASAHANEQGQAPDRLLRIAAQRCGQSLSPEVADALGRLARR